MTDDPTETSALVARREQLISEVLAEYDQDYRLALGELAHRLAVAEQTEARTQRDESPGPAPGNCGDRDCGPDGRP